jgi:hypothetical protein
MITLVDCCFNISNCINQCTCLKIKRFNQLKLVKTENNASNLYEVRR